MDYSIPSNILALNLSPAFLRRAPKSRIVNVVATYDLNNASIDMFRWVLEMSGISFCPSRFAAAKMRWGGAMILAFCGGRAVCPGANSVTGARVTALRFTGMLLQAGELVCYRSFRIQNIVCHACVPFEVDIDGIHEEYRANTNYKSDRFPGLTFRMKSPEVVFNIFVTGQVVITGSRDFAHSERCWAWLYASVLVRYNRGTEAQSTSSAAYKMEVLRRKNTIVAECANISMRYARRADGPLARSDYAPLLTHTPARQLSTPSASVLATPYINAAAATDDVSGDSMQTPRQQTDAATAAAAAAAEPVTAATLLSRLANEFSGHSIRCDFVCAQDGAEEWRRHLTNLNIALAGVEGDDGLYGEVAPHVAAGCIGASVLQQPDTLRSAALSYIAQLHAALGDFADADDGGSDEQRAGSKDSEQTAPKSGGGIEAGGVSLCDVMDIDAAHRLDLLRGESADAACDGLVFAAFL